MKNYIVIVILLTGLFAKAQQENLFTNDWYVTQLTIDEENFFTPEGDDNGPNYNYFTKFEDETYFQTDGCNTFWVEMEELDDDSFQVLGITATLNDCENPIDYEFVDYDNYYYSIFSYGLGGPIEGEFQYEITSNVDGSKALEITNPDGNKAYYNNTKLSNQEVSDLEKGNFQLAFQKDELIIQSPKLKAKSVSIYDLAGKLILNSEVSSFQKINTSGLPKGIYIIKIADEKGKIYSKKIRKE